MDEYLAGVPEPARVTLKHIRAVIRSVVPKETTEVISYGIPMFKYNGMLVGYAAFQESLQFVSDGVGSARPVREGAWWVPDFEGDDSVSLGSAFAGCAGEEDCEGAG